MNTVQFERAVRLRAATEAARRRRTDSPAVARCNLTGTWKDMLPQLSFSVNLSRTFLSLMICHEQFVTRAASTYEARIIFQEGIVM